ncbi:MAG: hypothetical protein MJ196_12185 [Treponemataceae bacterium]|nr:hypothetical protein [Treponemataceae bacterium]
MNEQERLYLQNKNLEEGKILYLSVEDFYKDCTTGIEFPYKEHNYLIEFDDPFTGTGVCRIHVNDDDCDTSYFDSTKCMEFNNLEELVHNYKIGLKTLAEIICDDNGISRSVLPVHRDEKKQLALFGEIDNELQG